MKISNNRDRKSTKPDVKNIPQSEEGDSFDKETKIDEGEVEKNPKSSFPGPFGEEDGIFGGNSDGGGWIPDTPPTVEVGDDLTSEGSGSIFDTQEGILDVDIDDGTSFSTPSQEQNIYADEEELTLNIDPDVTYFFVVGPPSSGKSTMMSGLVYYLRSRAEGRLKVLNSKDESHHVDGLELLEKMKQSVRKGEFMKGSKRMVKKHTFPDELNLQFIPQDAKKPSMKFSFVDMAGDDLERIMATKDGSLNPRIQAYLDHPECNLVFIFTIDVNDTDNFSEDMIDRFLDHLDSVGHENNPVLFAATKWDKVKGSYDDVRDYFESELAVLNNVAKRAHRDVSIIDFTIGSTTKDNTFTYDFKDSERIFNWMYQLETGYSLKEPVKRSFFQRLFKGN